MEANELRIGNFMNHTCLNESDEKYSIPVLIKDISFNVKMKAYQMLVCENYDDYINNIFFDTLMLDDEELFPIPLTEDWLIKFGCTSGGYGIYHLEIGRKGFYISTKEGNHINFRIDIGMDYCELIDSVDYVHQFQNLIFALTGEELKIINSD